ncbi:hypothetical protein LCGC14_2161740 [marine sediment metagenome]|uniref:Uncharacterized protein n=1 Tax=marine sediment metagenome TaxID=412755 RepID=A0A0F9G5E5_9ZZZZ
MRATIVMDLTTIGFVWLAIAMVVFTIFVLVVK